MFEIRRMLASGVLLLGLSFDHLGGAADAARAESQAAPGVWHQHDYVFHFLGVTSTYSCSGLADQLQRLLRQAGARPDARVQPLCSLSPTQPDTLAQAQLRFWSLMPAAEAPVATAARSATVPGIWRHVQWQQARGQGADQANPGCELVQQFSKVVLPFFTTRDPHSQFDCTPRQASSFSISFEVFSAASDDSAAAGREH